MPATARELFERFKKNQYQPHLRGVRGTYLFDIDQVGHWFVSVNDGAIMVEETKRDAECVIRCDEQDFVDMVEGRRNPITAAMQGRVQVHGDIALAQKFHGFVGTRVEEERGAA